MAFIDESDRRRIEEAVRRAETKTTAEFVCVVAKASADYLYMPTLAAACLTFVLSGLALLLLPSWSLERFYALQVTTFVALAIAFRWQPIRMWLVPPFLKYERARVHAHQLFLDFGLAATRERNGVLLFVSLAEHYVEIIADVGIEARLGSAPWPPIIERFTGDVRAGRVAEGFLTAIDACTTVLANAFPPSPNDVNELPNRLIEL